jgi:hydrogenase maturation protease
VRRIIGIGSPFGADQLGWRAVDLLQAAPLANAELLKLDRPGSLLIRYFSEVADLILIDAVQTGREPPGTPIRLEVGELSAAGCRTSTHGFGVAEALQMAGQLGLMPDKLLLIGIETGPNLSLLPEIESVRLLRLIESHIG